MMVIMITIMITLMMMIIIMMMIRMMIMMMVVVMMMIMIIMMIMKMMMLTCQVPRAPLRVENLADVFELSGHVGVDEGHLQGGVNGYVLHEFPI